MRALYYAHVVNWRAAPVYSFDKRLVLADTVRFP